MLKANKRAKNQMYYSDAMENDMNENTNTNVDVDGFGSKLQETDKESVKRKVDCYVPRLLTISLCSGALVFSRGAL